MGNVPSRLRADLIEFAVARENEPGLVPLAEDFRQVGLISGGVTLPDPQFEWEPFYGLGVDDRNFTHPIQGRHQFQGSIPSIYLTHAEGRFLLEMLMGVAYNTASPTGGTVTAYDAGTGELTTAFTSVPTRTNAAGGTATHIVISNTNGATNAPWAYIGATSSTSHPYRDRALKQQGWNGKEPVTGTDTWPIRAINNIDYGTSGSKTVVVRQSIVQPTFLSRS